MSNPHKRKRDTTFLNKSRPSSQQSSSPAPKKIKIIKNRCDVIKKDKYEFIQYMHDNPELSVEQCIGKMKIDVNDGHFDKIYYEKEEIKIDINVGHIAKYIMKKKK